MSVQWMLTEFPTQRNVRKWKKRFNETDADVQLDVQKVAVYIHQKYGTEHELGQTPCIAIAMYAKTVKPEVFATLTVEAKQTEEEEIQRMNAKVDELDLETRVKVLHVALHLMIGMETTELRRVRAGAFLLYEDKPFNQKLQHMKARLPPLQHSMEEWPEVQKNLIRRIVPQMGVEDHPVGFVMACTIFAKNRKNFTELLRQTRAPSTTWNTTEKCGLCETTLTMRLDCCGQFMCRPCLFNVLEVCDCKEPPQMIINCPFCRSSNYSLDDFAAIKIMKNECPSHAKVVKNKCTGRPMVIYHLPCDGDGCYECELSKLRAVLA
jgi:hypothetical protein